MKFNLPEYKVMHLDRIKESVKNSLNGTELLTIKKKRDFGILITVKLLHFYSYNLIRGKCKGIQLNNTHHKELKADCLTEE